MEALGTFRILIVGVLLTGACGASSAGRTEETRAPLDPSAQPSVSTPTATASPRADGTAPARLPQTAPPTPRAATAPPTPRAVTRADYLGQRVTAGLSLSTSIECYTFYSDSRVELRHNGAAVPTDRGTYRGDSSGGQIDWRSGRYSTVVRTAAGLTINGLRVSAIQACEQ